MKSTKTRKKREKALEPFVERVKTPLGDRVKEVRLTHRLTDTPAIVTTDADEMSTQMAKLVRRGRSVRAGSEIHL